jgi:hypothetical protein
LVHKRISNESRQHSAIKLLFAMFVVNKHNDEILFLSGSNHISTTDQEADEGEAGKCPYYNTVDKKKTGIERPCYKSVIPVFERCKRGCFFRDAPIIGIGQLVLF